MLPLMHNKRGLVMGVANQNSIAWGIARTLHAHGAEMAFTYQGEALGKRLPPMVFHVSPAKRAQETFHALCTTWQGLAAQHGKTTPALYAFDYRQILDWIRRYGVLGDSLALIGHNPAFTEMVCYLVGPNALDHLPTAGWVEMNLPIDHWRDIQSAQHEGELLYRLFPKMLGSEA